MSLQLVPYQERKLPTTKTSPPAKPRRRRRRRNRKPAKTARNARPVRSNASNALITRPLGELNDTLSFHPAYFNVSSRRTKWGEASVIGFRSKFPLPVASAAIAGGIFSGTVIYQVDTVSMGSTRLSFMSTLYERYRYTKLRFIYVASCPITAQGNAILAYVPDGNAAYDSDYTGMTPSDFAEFPNAICFPLRAPRVILEVNPDDFLESELRYTDYGSTTVTANNRQSTMGAFGGFLQNFIPSFGYGDIYVEAEVELYNPQARITLGLQTDRKDKPSPSVFVPPTSSEPKIANSEPDIPPGYVLVPINKA
jgi:hypothetical protein